MDDKALLRRYVALAREERGVTFLGRLATYRYLDMHVTIDEALQVAQLFVACAAHGQEMPAFGVAPLA